ncbi:MAG: hypothetical protein P9L91_01270 [Candidatus Zophobacter franzmannii]|nr:hypothetical protein [Candidatus Zophobacter franzmannii]
MKPDKLEQFVLDNREGFDDLAPPAGSWEKIKEEVKPIRQINWTARLVRIAAAVVIFVSSYIFIDYLVADKEAGLASGDTESDQELYEEVPLLGEARGYYSGLISNMEREVYTLAGENSGIVEDINIEFEELDRVFSELKADLKDDAANEEVLEAMIQNYRIKLQVLEEILIQLKSADKKNHKGHESKKVIL